MKRVRRFPTRLVRWTSVYLCLAFVIVLTGLMLTGGVWVSRTVFAVRMSNDLNHTVAHAPYIYTWNNGASGTYHPTASLTDALSASTTSTEEAVGEAPPDPTPQGQGCTTGFWKANANKQGANAWGVSVTTKLSDLFTIPSCLAGCAENYGSITLYNAVSLSGGKTVCQKAELLYRAAAAAYLNATCGCVPYPISAGSIVTEVNAAAASCDLTTITNEAIRLDGFNSLTCPFTQSGECTNSLNVLRLDPLNRTGAAGEDPLSRNFNWRISVVGLTGRADLDLGLSLSYNSLATWIKNGSFISFDDDRGFPSAGFRLGFPVIQPVFYNSQAAKYSYLMIAPSGSRVELRQVGTSNLYQSVDSSYLMLDANTMTVRTNDGTQLSYSWMGNYYQCTQIKDRNGNYLTINYDGLGRIDTVIDTLARTIKFNYTGADLVSITQAWTVGGQAQTHPWASFTYTDEPIQTNFSGLSVIGPQNGSSIHALTKVTLADYSHYDFEYTSWGQVWKISEYATDNHLLNYRSYNLPQNNNTAQTDCPRFTERHDWAENWNRDINGIAQEVITNVAIPSSTTIPGTALTGTLTQVTLPNGTSQTIYFGSAATVPAWQNGLPLLTETYDGTAVKQRWVTNTWTQDDTTVAYPLNPRVTETNIYDPAGNHARTRIDYATFNLADGTSCRYPSDTYEYQADAATVLRRAHVDYQMNSTYTSRRILGLPSAKFVCNGSQGEVPCNDTSGASLFAKVTFQYDETGSILGSDAPIQHDNANYGSTFVTGRANLSSVKRYDVANSSQFTVNSMQYNTAGAVVKTVDGAGHQVQFSYADAFAANGTTLDPALSFVTLAYPTTVTDPDNYTATTRYNYDFGAATWKQTPLPNVTDNQPGPQQKIEYDSIGRLQRVTNLVNSAYTRFIYGPNYVESFATVNNLADEAHSVQIFDGMGRVIAKAGNHPGSVGGFSGQLLVYDNVGRVIKQSNPTETTVTISGVPIQPYNWVTAGDDALAGWLYTQQTYDWKGRPLVTTNPDNTTKTASYTGCGCAGGQVVTLTDEVGRQQKVYGDVLGRQWKTEVLNWNGSVYSTTTTTLNARDQATLIRQTDNATGAYQDTTLTYDAYGRLQSKHVPEQNAGTATVYAYNNDDTTYSVTDARGASATYSHNGRHLVTGITYSAPAGITPASNVSFAYDAVGNRTSMTDGLGTQSYSYDSLSQMTSETRTFNDPNNPAMTGVSKSITYVYNLAGELSSITDPFNTQVGYNYDSAGRVSAVTGSGSASTSSYGSNFQYRAWGAVKHLAFGSYSWGTDTTYDARMQPTSFVFGPSGLRPYLSLTYQRNYDCSLQYSHDVLDPRFDRSYSYDQAGRITQALSGPAASGGADNNNRPYLQYYSFDAWNNMTSRWGKHWSHNIGFGGTYTNNRMDGWTYDADGRNTVSNTVTSTYDAAGRLIQTVGPQRRTNPPLTLISGYDGDGIRIKKIEYGESYYSLTSTVLGGVEIAEIYGTANQFFGQKQKGHVYVNGNELAEEDPTGLECKLTDPGGGELAGTQLDPLGDDVGEEDPYLPQEDPGFSYPHLGDVTDPGGGCVFGDFPVPCSNQVRKTSGWSILTSLLPHLSQFGLPINRSSTPPIFATPESQVTPRGVLTDIFAGTPIGGMFFPRAEDLWPFVSDTSFAPQNPGLTQQQTNARNNLGECSVHALLDTLSYSEGADYNTVVKGTVIRSPNDPSLVGKRNVTITDFSQHPNILVNVGPGLNSTAAGRYQFLNRTWNGLGLPSFSPFNQDIGAAMLMQRRGMITPLLNGDVEQAIMNGNAEWASLPGSPYGQGTRSMNSLKKVYNQSFLNCVQAMHEIHQGLRDNNGV